VDDDNETPEQVAQEWHRRINALDFSIVEMMTELEQEEIDHRVGSW
jgi:hypothetical protein